MNDKRTTESAPAYEHPPINFAYGQYSNLNLEQQIGSRNASSSSPTSEEITEHALQILSYRTRIIMGALLNTAGDICKYLSYGFAIVFAGNHYAQYYHHSNTRLPIQTLHYYRNKNTYTETDSIDYYSITRIDTMTKQIKQSMKTTGLIFAATVTLWALSRGLKRVSRVVLRRRSTITELV
jgi:hypothetical protein